MEFTETDNVVVINSASKLFSMTGWRLGWVYGSEERVAHAARPPVRAGLRVGACPVRR